MTLVKKVSTENGSASDSFVVIKKAKVTLHAQTSELKKVTVGKK